MTLQLVTENNFRNPGNTSGLSSMRSGGRAFAAMWRPTMCRIQPVASAAANDVPLQPTIEEAVSRWIDQNPSQLYRGGA
jgi:hypothetical protein